MAHIGFSAAVTLLAVNLMPELLVYLTLAGLAVLLLVSLLLPHLRKAVTAPLCLGAAVFACLVFLTVYNGTVKPVQTLSGKTENAVIHTVSYAEQRDGKYIYTAVLDSVEAEGVPQGVKIHLTSDNPLSADVYQYVNARIKFSKCGTNAFDSYGYWGKGIYIYGNVKSFRATHDYVKTPLRYLVHLRRDMVETLTAANEGDPGALAAAVITGDKSRLSAKAYSDFKTAGLTHIMAVSGLHLSVVCGMVLFLLKLLRVNKNSSAVIVMLTALAYAALSGFSKSVIRAGIMVGVLLLSDIAERKGDTLNALGTAVFLICLNPFAVSDVSAVLSVLAVLALLTLYPRWLNALYKRLHFRPQGYSVWATLWRKPTDYLLKSIAASFSILVVTLPAGVIFFDGVALASLLANAAVIPLGSAQVVLSLLSYIGCKLGFLAGLFNVASYGVTSLILRIVAAAAATGFGITFGKYFALAVGICLLLVAVCFLAARKEWMKPAALICAVLMCVTVATEGAMYRRAAHLYLSGDCGAAICDGQTVVWGVNSRSEYLEMSAVLGKGDIDILICDGSDHTYAERLAEEKGCRTAVMPEASDSVEFPADAVVQADAYTQTLSDKLNCSCAADADNKMIITITINGCTFGNEAAGGACITAADGTVTDGKGIINASRSTVIYDIYNETTYDARRADAWQS